MVAMLKQLLAGNPWPFVIVVLTLGVCFLGFLFRETIRETLLWKLRAKWEHDKKVAEINRLFTDGEREILIRMARDGRLIRLSFEEVPQGGSPRPILGYGDTQVVLASELETDLYSLERKGYLTNNGKMTYGLTEKGRTAGDEMIVLFAEMKRGKSGQ